MRFHNTFVVGLVDGQNYVGRIDSSGFQAKMETFIVAWFRGAADNCRALGFNRSRLIEQCQANVCVGCSRIRSL